MRNTLELLDAVTSGLHRWKEDYSDSKWTWLEKLAWLKERERIQKAIEGIKEIPSELWNADQEEVQQVIGQVDLILVELGFAHRSREIAQVIVSAAHQNAQAIKTILEMPPRAQAVEE